jgi:hypothetical protein
VWVVQQMHRKWRKVKREDGRMALEAGNRESWAENLNEEEAGHRCW